MLKRFRRAAALVSNTRFGREGTLFMQWLLQDYDDTRRLAEVLDRLGLPYSWHRVVPFLGELIPAPVIADPDAVVMFGSYAMWREALAKGWQPGVFVTPPFVHETVWQPFMLNGPDALFLTLAEIPQRLADDGTDWFIRPVDDSKAQPGGVRSTADILRLARQVLVLDPADIPDGALRHDTLMMLTRPARILQEWRVWIVAGQVVTWSLYRDGDSVTYRAEIDPDAREFAQAMADLNPGHAPAYVLDICRTDQGLRLLETNCLNAAGLYAANAEALIRAIEALPPA